MKKTIYLTLPLLIILSGLILLKHPLQTDQFGLHTESSVMKDIKIKKILKDSVQWVASIKEARFTQNQDVAYLSDVSIYYPERQFRLSSESGVYNLKKGTIRFDSTVKGYTEKLQFETSNLKYNPEKGSISAKNGVIIRGKRLTITGERAKLKDRNRLEIEGNVKTIFK